MNFRRKARGLAAVWLSINVLPSSAAPAATLRLDGTRSASTVLTLNSSTRFDLLDLRVTGKWSYAGLYLESLDVPPTARADQGRRFGAVLLRDVHAPSAAPEVLPLSDPNATKLNPGRYRAYLLADGRVTITIPISGSRSLRLQPRTPATAQAAMSSDILTGPLTASGDQNITLTGRRSVNVVALLVGRARAYAGSFVACLHTPEGSCGDAAGGADAGLSGFMVDPRTDYDLMFYVLYDPGVLHPGRMVAHEGGTNYTTLKFASGGAFTLALQ